MTIADGLMILAVIAGPILAVQAQKWIERWKEAKQRKEYVFKTLMATRATPLSPRFVEALNMIHLEFSGKNAKEKAVIDAWNIYHDHLQGGPRDPRDPAYQAKLDAWGEKTQDCRTELLYKMSLALGYSFDKVQLKKGVHAPQGYADVELELSTLRRGILELVFGKRPLPVAPFGQQDTAPQEKPAMPPKKE
jgi:hypothetical protein